MRKSQSMKGLRIRLGKGGKAAAQRKGRVQPRGKARWGPGRGCRCDGTRPGCPGSGERTQPRSVSWRQPRGHPHFADTHRPGLWARAGGAEPQRCPGRVCVSLLWSTALHLTRARRRVPRRGETPGPPASGPPVPAQLSPVSAGFTGAAASPVASLPPDGLSHVFPLLPGPSRSPCTQSRAAQGSRDAQHWLGAVCGSGHGHNPSAP